MADSAGEAGYEIPGGANRRRPSSTTMHKSQELRLRAARCRMVAARYSENRRQPLLDLARELEREAEALDAGHRHVAAQ